MEMDESWSFIKDKGKGRKYKGKKGQGKDESYHKGQKKKKYLSKIKCFHYHQFRHYATKCPN